MALTKQLIKEIAENKVSKLELYYDYEGEITSEDYQKILQELGAALKYNSSILSVGLGNLSTELLKTISHGLQDKKLDELILWKEKKNKIKVNLSQGNLLELKRIIPLFHEVIFWDLAEEECASLIEEFPKTKLNRVSFVGSYNFNIEHLSNAINKSFIKEIGLRELSNAVMYSEIITKCPQVNELIISTKVSGKIFENIPYNIKKITLLGGPISSILSLLKELIKGQVKEIKLIGSSAENIEKFLKFMRKNDQLSLRICITENDSQIERETIKNLVNNYTRFDDKLVGRIFLLEVEADVAKSSSQIPSKEKIAVEILPSVSRVGKEEISVEQLSPSAELREERAPFKKRKQAFFVIHEDPVAPASTSEEEQLSVRSHKKP